MQKLITVAINDFKLVFRDNSLKIFLVLPLLNLLVIRYAVPYIADIYKPLNDYLAVILMFATMQGSTAFGFIYSMVLVDEKDTSVAKVYGIVPVSKFWFMVFRLIPAFALATTATFLLLLAEPFFRLPVFAIIAYSALAGLVAPIMVLFVTAVAKNKIEAMTWQKLFNLPLFLPVLALFVPAPSSWLFAIFPTYWAFSGFDALIEGGHYWTYLIIGFAHGGILLVWMLKRFTENHFS